MERERERGVCVSEFVWREREREMWYIENRQGGRRQNYI